MFLFFSQPVFSTKGKQVTNTGFTLKAHFHPEIPVLLVEKLQLSGDSVEIVDCFDALTPFEWDDLTDENLTWPTELLVSTRIHTIFPKYARQFMGFRRCDGGIPFLDMICVERIEVPKSKLYYLSISHLGELAVETPIRGIDEYILQRRTAAGCPICLGISQSEGMLVFLRMPDRFGEEPTFICLKLPHDRRSLDWEDVLAFDDVYGTLLLDLGESEVDSLSIVQY